VKDPQGRFNIPLCSCNLWTQNTVLWIPRAKGFTRSQRDD